MSLRRVTRVWAAIGLAALAGTGCTCLSTPPFDCTDLSVAFVTPDDGAQVNKVIDVQVQASARVGTFEPAEPELRFKLVTDADFSDPVVGTVDGSRATFLAVTLPVGEVVLQVRVPQKDTTCALVVTRTVTVVDTALPSRVTRVSFPQDLDVDGVLNGAELPAGTKIQMLVEAANVSGMQVQGRQTSGGGVVGAAVDFVVGAATVTLDQLPETDTGSFQLFAEVLSGGLPMNSPAANPAALAVISIDRIPPTCSLTAPVKAVIGPRDDADLGAGYQVRVAALVNSDAASLIFRLTGGAADQTSPAIATPPVDPSYDFTIPVVGTTAYAVVLEASDAYGNVCTATRAVTADFDPPTVTVTAPLASGGPLTTFGTTASASVVGAEGEQACFFLVGPAPATTETQMGCTTITSGAAALAITFPSNGTWTVVARATDAAGNEGSGSEVGVVMNSPDCQLAFTRPATDPSLITGGAAPGGNYRFDVASPNCPSTNVTLARDSTQVGSATTNGAGAASITVAVTDGHYFFTACIDNVAPRAPTCTTIEVSVALTAPVLTPAAAPINANRDSDSSVAGVQSLISFSGTIPVGGRAAVCSDQGARPTGAADCPNGAPGWWVLKDNVSNTDLAFTYPDGQYQLLVVIVLGTTWAESAPVAVDVDGVRPCVAAGSLVIVRDANGDSHLNLAELNGQPPRLLFNLGCGDTDASIVSVVVRDVGAAYLTLCPGTVNGLSFAADATITGTAGGVNLSQATATEADYVVAVELTDRLQNKNIVCAPTTARPLNTAAVHALRVDKVAPTCGIVEPSAPNPLGTAAVPGGNLSVLISTPPDVGTGGVAVSLAGTTTTSQTLDASAGQASTTFAVSGTATWTLSVTCTDESGNAQSPAVTKSLDLDLDPPTCSVSLPAPGSPYGFGSLLTTMNIGGADGQQATLRTTLRVNPIDVFTVPVGGAVAKTYTYDDGTQDITLSVSDAAGNPCQSTLSGIVVSAGQCALAVPTTTQNANGVWVNASNPNLDAGAGVMNVLATTPCGSGRPITLTNTSSGTVYGPQTTDTSGRVSFPAVPVQEGQAFQVSTPNQDGGTSSVPFIVDWVPPQYASIRVNGAAPTTAAGNAMYVVATSDNENLGHPGYYPDQSASPGAQYNLTLNGITGIAEYGKSGTVDVTLSSQGSPLFTDLLTSDQTLNAPITIPQNGTGVMQVVLTDPAGNTTTALDVTATGDTEAPSAPVLIMGGSATAVTDVRAAQVRLVWNTVYDDPDSASGGAGLNYDVRWTTSLKSAGAGLGDAGVFFSSSSAWTDTNSLPWTSGPTTTHTIGVPPMNTYFVVVRARDDVGNYSAVPAVASTQIDNPGTVDVILNPTGVASQLFGKTLAAATLRVGPDGGAVPGRGIGSIDDDLYDDIIIGAASTPTVSDGGFLFPDGGTPAVGASITGVGVAYVCYGGPGFSASSCQLLGAPDPFQNSNYGTDVALGDVTSLASSASARVDAIVGAPGFDGNRGRAFLYHGLGAGGRIDPATYLEFRGTLAGTANTGSRVGETTNIIADIDGDGISELLLSGRGDGPLAGQGRIYVFKGRSWANWVAKRTAGGLPYIAVSAATADYVLDGQSPVDTVGSVNNYWGYPRGAVTSLGPRVSGAGNSFAIADIKNSINKAYFYEAATLIAAGGPVPVPTAAGSFLEDTDHGTGGINGFGTRIIGGVDITGSASLTDLVVTQARTAAGGVPASTYARLYVDGTASGYTLSRTITGNTVTAFGIWAEVLDLNGDGRIDIAVGESTGTVANPSSAWVFYQRSDRDFDSSAAGGFWQSRITSTGSAARGIGMAAADVDGDGRIDWLVGDNVENPGRVLIWH